MRAKRKQKILIAVLIFCLTAMYQIFPLSQVSAVSITDAKDTLSDSDMSVTNVRHDFSLVTGTSTPTGDYIRIVFPGDFSGIVNGNVTCPTNMTASTTGQTVDCTATAPVASGTKAIIITNVTNPPTAGSKLINIYHNTAAGVEKERVQIMVFIISDVIMSATVNANLTFTILGVNAGVTINGVQTTATSSATTTPFGTLSSSASSTVGQRLTVSTNADDGYIVTVWEDQEMRSDSGSNINSFNNAIDGTGSTTPAAWVAPFNVLDSTNTYGHMGLTSDDSATFGNPDFTGNKYAGFSGTSTIQVMSHDGPCNATEAGKCLNNVAYTALITDLQEAGDYTNTLTYICTAQY